MAIKTFTTGEVLTASDTNTYLANSGLVYVTSATANSGSTMSIDNCFTSTYASYLVLLTFIPTAPTYGCDLRMRVGTDTTTGYNYGITGVDMSTAASFVTRATNANVFPLYCIADTSGRATSVIQIVNPQLAQFTGINAQSTDTRATTGYSGLNAGGLLRDTTQYNGLSFILGGGTGTISFMEAKIYGYRQA